MTSNDDPNILSAKEQLDNDNEDLLRKELDTEEMVTEETRYTAMLHMVEERMVSTTTKIEKRKFDKIMRMLTHIRIYRLEMSEAMAVNPYVKRMVNADCNLYLEQILDYMKLMKAKEGWTANEIFSILKAEEKTAKKWGIFSTKREDAELADS